MKKNLPNIKKVAIIGAGAAGVISAIMLKKRGFECTLFDTRNCFGGLWNYGNTPIYNSLVTNLPKQIMEISREHPFKEELPSFIRHFDMLEYINTLAEQYNLKNNTHFLTKVISVTPESDDAFCKWSLTTQHVNKDEQKEYIFDACIVCNGHHDTPIYADIKGIEHFQGSQEHACDYDNPMPYAGKKILVIGASFSATDIAREISTTCDSLVISDRNLKDGIEQHNNLYIRGGLSHIDTNGNIYFKDEGATFKPDIIIHCSGYAYNFPFLNQDIVHIEHNFVSPLYKQILHCKYPSLSFIGLPFDVVPFLLFKYQSQYVGHILANPHTLPSETERFEALKYFEEHHKKRGLGSNKKHSLRHGMLWEYFKDLAILSGFSSNYETKLLNMYQQIYDNIGKPSHIGADDNYRLNNFEIDYKKYTWNKVPKNSKVKEVA